MALDISTIAEDFAEEFRQGGEAIFKTGHGQAALKGKTLQDAGTDVCGWLAWVRQNTPFRLRPFLELTEDGPLWNIWVVRESDGVVVKQFGNELVTGNLNGKPPGDYLHDKLKMAIYRLCKKIEARV